MSAHSQDAINLLDVTHDAGGAPSPRSFFRRIDWAAFWTATGLSFLVYFLTLGPSVTLEDSGELAVAGDYLGVPHPPGYPIWTLSAWVFARVFEWVTFRGQPTPAWSIALCSAVFGALATGLTAMLITRSSSDMLHDSHNELHQADTAHEDRICWVGGVAGSLLFAFSPVMWSQATIVEVYALNAFFLMLILLLTYRWMRQPTHRVLWITAFVFGLGLTNYQVLLLAALPLVVVIFLRDILLFRDFLLQGIPFALTLLVLKLGAMPPVEGFGKLKPILAELQVPSPKAFVAGLAVAGVGLLAAILWHELRRHGRAARPGLERQATALIGGCFGLGCLLMLGARFFVVSVKAASELAAPLVHPQYYMTAALIVTASIGLCVVAAMTRGQRRWNDPLVWGPLVALGVLMLFQVSQLSGLPAAPIVAPGGSQPPFSWGPVTLGFLALLAVLVAIALTTPMGVYFAGAVCVIELTLYLLLRRGALAGLNHPLTWWFWMPVILNFVFLGLGWILLPHGRTVSLTLLAAEAGVSFYVYMPIVSDLRNPPMNWGYPRTWEGFKHAITRGQYEKIAPTNVFTAHFIQQLGSYFTDMRTQFTLLVAPLGFLPFAAWHFRTPGGRQVRALHAAIALFLVSSCFVLLAVVPATARVFDALRVDKWFLGGVLLLAACGGVAIALTQLDELVERTLRRRSLSEALTVGITLLGCAALLVGFVAKGFFAVLQADDPILRARQNTTLIGLVAAVLAVLVAGLLLVVLPLVRRHVSRAFEFRFGGDHVMQQWLIATVAAFMMMSVLLIVLANPKGDLQDAFIQKVKFVSSHGLFAIWIGYGLVFALAVFDALLSRRAPPRPDGRRAPARLPRLAAMCFVLVLPLIPIHENYYNQHLVFELGGAEQNGHDYGWQFGNYQLRGAEAVQEELAPDEEPLPNPTYPPEMGPGAVFFGGTDPGRFVPTYMIYSAKVREDVFLITQNALADNTYMSVMRDLYGDRIWIPTPDDSARAFQVYVEEVDAGKRPRNAELVIENGRVQVSGALGVMEINGILCDMIFQRNKERHDFYVEESYVIPWMFPYLTPHGLILKLNREQTGLTPANQRDDLDFWDWYVRRLTREERFRRDVVAQKSFSKLRSAIGGCYAARGLAREAEIAFREAQVLYAVSPEATFRMVQDVLMRTRRYDDAIDMLDQFVKADPNNDRGASFRDYLRSVQQTENKLKELVQRLPPDGRPDPATAMEMAGCYRDLGNHAMVARCLEPMLVETGVPPQLVYEAGLLLRSVGNHAVAARAMDRVMAMVGRDLPADRLLAVARVYADAQLPVKMIAPITRYLQLRPDDWQGWLDLATLYLLQKQPSQAQSALRRALELGGDQALQVIESDPHLRSASASLLRDSGAGRLPDGGFLR